jgi:3'(2'), 5'-bisphosphate nucleotidase
MSDHDTARQLAKEAGELLLTVRAEDDGSDPVSLRNAGDQSAHELLVRLLGERCPGDAVLSEEGATSLIGINARRVWIVDPLDGTREFSEGRSDWAVHVALVEDGTLVAGAVAIPSEGRVYATGAGQTVAPAESRRPRFAVSRTRPGPISAAVAERLGGDLVPMGSAGVKSMAVLTGDVDAYLHSGGQYVWDSAAPVVVAAESGLHTSRLDGSPLTYTADTTWLPDLVICRPELADPILTTVCELST